MPDDVVSVLRVGQLWTSDRDDRDDPDWHVVIASVWGSVVCYEWVSPDAHGDVVWGERRRGVFLDEFVPVGREGFGAHPTVPPGFGAHHLRFTRFEARLLAITNEYFRSRPWRGDTLAKAQRWVGAAAEVYGMPAPAVVLTTPARAAGSGCYQRPPTHAILLPGFVSVVTLFHEFRHALQDHGAAMVRARYGDVRHEEDARAWSLSLFHHVRPVAFRDAVMAGRVLYVPAAAIGAVAS